MKISNWAGSARCKLNAKAKKAGVVAGSAILAGGMLFCGDAAADTNYFEDFESVSLDPGTGSVPVSWSRTVSGWTVDNSMMNGTSEAIEYQGGAILDVAEWLTESGGQGRTSEGTISPTGKALVFDPDEWDDERIDGDGDSGYNSTWFRTFDFTGEDLNSITIAFDYEFRAYDDQQMLAEVSFDGGATFETILDLDSNVIGNSLYASGGAAFDSGDFTPTSEEMILSFSMINGGNDWWGVIDNVSVTSSAIPEPTAAGVIGLGLLGAASRRRRK